MTPSLTTGIHHLGLTVPHVGRAQDFFVSVLGFELVAERPDYPAAFVSDGTVLLTLWQAQTESPVPFDRTQNLGLHHFALKLAPGRSLEEVFSRLSERSDVTIEFAPEPLKGTPLKHLMCTVAGGLRMEILAAETPEEATGPQGAS